MPEALLTSGAGDPRKQSFIRIEGGSDQQDLFNTVSKLKSNLHLVNTKIPKDFKDLSLPRFKEILLKKIVEKLPEEDDLPDKIKPLLSSIGDRLGDDVAFRIQTKMKN